MSQSGEYIISYSSKDEVEHVLLPNEAKRNKSVIQVFFVKLLDAFSNKS